jgi:hypothetical protein
MTSPSPLPPSTANWHWKNKNVGAWAKTWFQQELTAISIKGDGDEFVKISDVTTVDGDVELGQRKSKYATFADYCILRSNVIRIEFYRLITIYDVNIELVWEGKASDGSDVSGTLAIPEVSHEVTLDGLSDYVVRLHTSGSVAFFPKGCNSTSGASRPSLANLLMRFTSWRRQSCPLLWKPSLQSSLWLLSTRMARI